ncbi:hypothetical protein DPEC_G00274440 [Dallia pectoralis]|uniref:Uncharacterized protein n=1 Tax=Dallia pectoralis TaxID=75939 RepID=A0ACC2FKZ2_DALPE|nr:hypothetical protein DPEC_G00274440 [Dallia pectoralis]
MALSQIQCLDENNVNPRTHESKPEFFYSEDQRLALETLLRDGRQAYGEFLQASSLRCFLSDREVDRLTGAVEAYDPGSELVHADPDGDDPPLSLQYWPDRSDCSLPWLDLGWPDCASYRGVTRVTVYAQPPLDGLTHIKEVVRKSIGHAQKVIAVVMDQFTDVDIFRDLLEACFRRKVCVYILLERTALPHFLSMAERAAMHSGHLKSLRVRVTGGTEFFSRSCTRVRGRLGHRLLLIDGDKAVSGSYSFTWTASRLDRHLVTMVTGQGVDSFDRLFRDLYLTSSEVDLRRVAVELEPVPEPLPPTPPVAPLSAVDARKLFSPKYALMTGNATVSDASLTTSRRNSNPVSTLKIKERVREPVEAPPLHPGLACLEKAYLIPYLPTWPEPDPSSDVIGFINVRVPSRPIQVHLQRSERFETSQAIRFHSPVTQPSEENQPDRTQPQPPASSPVTQPSEENQPNRTQPDRTQPQPPASSPVTQPSEENQPNRTQPQPPASSPVTQPSEENQPDRTQPQPPASSPVTQPSEENQPNRTQPDRTQPQPPASSPVTQPSEENQPNRTQPDRTQPQPPASSPVTQPSPTQPDLTGPQPLALNSDPVTQPSEDTDRTEPLTAPQPQLTPPPTPLFPSTLPSVYTCPTPPRPPIPKPRTVQLIMSDLCSVRMIKKTECPAPYIHSGPETAEQPHSGPETAEQPHSGPETAEQPHSGPETAEQPHSGPETAEQPHSGPETAEQPHSGPETAEQPHSGPETAEQPHSGPETTEQPHSGPETAEQPHSGPETTEQPHSGPETAEQPHSLCEIVEASQIQNSSRFAVGYLTASQSPRGEGVVTPQPQYNNENSTGLPNGLATETQTLNDSVTETQMIKKYFEPTVQPQGDFDLIKRGNVPDRKSVRILSTHSPERRTPSPVNEVCRVSPPLGNSNVSTTSEEYYECCDDGLPAEPDCKLPASGLPRGSEKNQTRNISFTPFSHATDTEGTDITPPPVSIEREETDTPHSYQTHEIHTSCANSKLEQETNSHLLHIEANIALSLEANSVPPLEANSVPPLEANSVPPLEANSVPPLEANSLLPLEANSLLRLEANSLLPLEANSLLRLEANSLLPLEANSLLPLEANSLLTQKKLQYGNLPTEELQECDSQVTVESRRAEDPITSQTNYRLTTERDKDIENATTLSPVYVLPINDSGDEHTKLESPEKTSYTFPSPQNISRGIKPQAYTDETELPEHKGPAELLREKSADIPAENKTDKLAEKQTEIEIPANRSVWRTKYNSADSPAERPVKSLTESPAEISADRPGESLTERPAVNQQERPTDIQPERAESPVSSGPKRGDQLRTNRNTGRKKPLRATPRSFIRGQQEDQPTNPSSTTPPPKRISPFPFQISAPPQRKPGVVGRRCGATPRSLDKACAGLGGGAPAKRSASPLPARKLTEMRPRRHSTPDIQPPVPQGRRQSHTPLHPASAHTHNPTSNPTQSHSPPVQGGTAPFGLSFARLQQLRAGRRSAEPHQQRRRPQHKETTKTNSDWETSTTQGDDQDKL